MINWELFVVEGPWMIVRDDVYYLMYSGNGANQPRYAIGYATADNPLGPFTKYEGNPILQIDRDHEFFGPGHHSLTVGPDGDLWMIYHTKLYGDIGWERGIRKNKIAFSEDGRIYVDLGLEPPDDDNDDDSAADDDTTTLDDDSSAGSGQADDDDDDNTDSLPDDDDDDDDGGCV